MSKNGFSLMEIMIAVVIIGILAAIAIPAYNGYMNRTRRADAITALETVALYEEKFFSENNQYGTIAQLIGVGFTDPNADANRNYAIVATPGGVNNSTFVATATPMNAQAGDTIIFAINNNGIRGTDDGGGGVSPNLQLWNSLRP